MALEPGALRLSFGVEYPTLDPARVEYGGLFAVARRVFSNLYAYDERGLLVADQAAGMPAVSADGMTVTITLKPDLVWSDGRPLVADDWVYGIKRQLNPALASGYAFALHAVSGARRYNLADPRRTSPDLLKRLRDAVGVSSPNGQTLRFDLVEPAPWFPSIFASTIGLPVREDIVRDRGRPEENQDWTIVGQYVGNGPYRLVTHQPGKQLTFEINPRYTGSPAGIQKIQYLTSETDAAALAAFRDGQIHVMYASSAILDAVKGDPTLHSRLNPGPCSCTTFIGLNTRSVPFDNLRVRQAMSAAFDREDYSFRVFGDRSLAATQFVPPQIPGHYLDLPGQTFDPKAAGRWLTRAGYVSPKELPPVRLVLVDGDVNRQAGYAVQAIYHQSLDLDVELEFLDSKTYQIRMRSPQTRPQMFFYRWCPDYPDPQDWYSLVFQTGQRDNYSQWSNPQFDRLTQWADTSLDRAARDALYHQAATILHAEAPVILTNYSYTPLLIRPELKGYRPHPLDLYFGQHADTQMTLSADAR